MQTPALSPDRGASDPDVENDPTIVADGGPAYVPIMSPLQMAYGGGQRNFTDQRLYRLERGYPFKRVGHMVPVMPQFKAQNLTVQNIASQPQANRSAVEITRPTVDPATTNDTNGTPFIGYPGFNQQNLT